jgi:PAS domain S-box-containing protein
MMPERPRVLVVDDEMGPRESLRMILKPHFEVAVVDSGEAALRSLSTFRPDLVVMDIKMPTMDGIELLRRIKARDASIEVVMITAYASLETVKSALSYGAFEYLIKPFSRHDVEETVRRALARRQGELDARGQVARLVREMRSLVAKTRELEEAARRDVAEPSLRVTQLSILREVSRGILGQLDPSEMTRTITELLKSGLGYDEVLIPLDPEQPQPVDNPAFVVCPIREDGTTLGHLVVDNRVSGRTIDPRERELLEMLCEYVAIAVRNSRLYGEIAETKRSLEQLIRSAGDAIISVNRAERIAGWNPAAERIFGATREEMLGQPITLILPETDYRQAKSDLSAEAPARHFEVRRPRKDGGYAELAVTLSAVGERGGEAEGILAIVRDVTAQREIEARLLQSQKLTAMGQLAGGIAHDFNNLLQAILGYAELMGQNPSNRDMVRRGVEVIISAATGGAETVKRIQEFARLRPDEAFISVDLNQVIQNALDITRPRWQEQVSQRGLPLNLHLDLAPLPLILGRPAALAEVITNLILNAIDAMPAGGTLTIGTRQEGKDVICTVTDTGVGVPEALHRRIFEPFFTTKEKTGTGLGLSISYSIVTRHSGEIWVESQEGRGTTFTLRFPGAEVSAPAAPTPGGQRPGQAGRVLLIENDPQVLEALAETLKTGGHAVTATKSGAEALAVFAPGRFDVVLTNIGMPGMTGWEVAERIHGLDPQVPIAFVTGWGLSDEDRKRCVSRGIRQCLFKPVRPADLLEAVQTVMAR